MDKLKTYYYLKLMKNFFDKLEVKKLMNMSGGNDKIVFFLRMQALSLDTKGEEGFIPFKGLYGNIYEEISAQLGINVDDVSSTIYYFEKVGWLKVIRNKDNVVTGIYIIEIEFGTESESLRRVTKFRLKGYINEYKNHLINDNLYNVLYKNIDTGFIKTKKQLDDIIQKALQCNGKNKALHCNAYIETELETELEIELEQQHYIDNDVVVLTKIKKFLKEHNELKLDLNSINLFTRKFNADVVLQQLNNLLKVDLSRINNINSYLYSACRDNYVVVSPKEHRTNGLKGAIKSSNLQKQLEMLEKENELT